ncbi:MAG TPA: hypothetical protein VN380_24810 [Thermoanaerobaculia bacterium]|jgi:hypothetical protein|nr:hypothetical protein [Thermoanaerobaculia bacterium]
MLPSRQPLLIVPIRDRRQRRRILTIRNCAITMLAVAIVIASFSIYSERRHSTAGYGGLFGTEVAATNRVERKSDVIDEGTVADQSAPDPMLGAPGAREQVLAATPTPIVPVTTTTIAPAVAEGHGATIVGDGKGITVVKAPATSTAPHPVLSGGIFKQQ